MKIFANYFIYFLSLVAISGLTSCLEDKEELYDVVGPVATIPAFTASKAAPVAGETIELTVRFYSPNVAVKELILHETVATDAKQQITSKAISGFDTNNSYVEKFSYTVPATAAGKKIVLEAAAVTTNDLTNTRTLTLTIP